MTTKVATKVDRSSTKFRDLVLRKRGHLALPSYLWAFDPGHTMGFASFYDLSLFEARQFGDLTDEATLRGLLSSLFSFAVKSQNRLKPDLVIIEDYKVYANKAHTHVNQELFTAKLIGRLVQKCDDNDIPWVMQMAAQGKGFMSDARLYKWDLWQSPDLGHAHDAIRHGAHYLLFGKA